VPLWTETACRFPPKPACRFEPKSPVGNSEICNKGHRSKFASASLPAVADQIGTANFLEGEEPNTPPEDGYPFADYAPGSSARVGGQQHESGFRRSDLRQARLPIFVDDAQKDHPGAEFATAHRGPSAIHVQSCRDASEIAGFRAAVLRVRIHLPPAKSRANSGTDVEAARLVGLGPPQTAPPVPASVDYEKRAPRSEARDRWAAAGAGRKSWRRGGWRGFRPPAARVQLRYQSPTSPAIVNEAGPQIAIPAVCRERARDCAVPPRAGRRWS
jgi:hypothetical protein